MEARKEGITRRERRWKKKGEEEGRSKRRGNGKREGRKEEGRTLLDTLD